MKPSRKLIANLRSQRAEWLERDRREFWCVVELVAWRLPDRSSHPLFVPFLWQRYALVSGEVPIAWHRAVTDECRRFFDRLPYRTLDDNESLSLARCKTLLGSRGAALSAADIEFVRDQLHGLACQLLDAQPEART